jgi:DNA invertase Pin-like site-specific DNA recombinase
MRAFGYVRLSKEDADSTSPQRQRQRIERLCAERGWELLETFEDIDISAFKGKHRPGFEAMMSRLAGHRRHRLLAAGPALALGRALQPDP